uniref:DNA sliding clamp PCNA n=1 Tax=Phaseolus coccineus TaxID=3886 RepID=A5Z0S2_PHACN|nr:proliferating cell nuclear antigen 2 [Phaseolus coccineus]ABQ96594.1 proliferating cell nuclear antigen 2 [Phaseolus coccineus]
MLEVRFVQGSLLKKVSEIIKEFIHDTNFYCSSTGIIVQAMNSNLSILALVLHSSGFEHYRCDHNFSMGMNLYSMVELLNRANGDDIITIKADDGGDTVTFTFESPRQNQISNFEMRLVDIDSPRYWIREDEAKYMEYLAMVKMPSSIFDGICRNISRIDGMFDLDLVITVTQKYVKFSTQGNENLGSASVLNPEEATVIDMFDVNKPVSMRIRNGGTYMSSFMKATTLSNTVSIILLNKLAVVFEYKIAEMEIPEIGYLRFYIPPITSPTS